MKTHPRTTIHAPCDPHVPGHTFPMHSRPCREHVSISARKACMYFARPAVNHSIQATRRKSFREEPSCIGIRLYKESVHVLCLTSRAPSLRASVYAYDNVFSRKRVRTCFKQLVARNASSARPRQDDRTFSSVRQKKRPKRKNRKLLLQKS